MAYLRHLLRKRRRVRFLGADPRRSARSPTHRSSPDDLAERTVAQRLRYWLNSRIRLRLPTPVELRFVELLGGFESEAIELESQPRSKTSGARVMLLVNTESQPSRVKPTTPDASTKSKWARCTPSTPRKLVPCIVER